MRILQFSATYPPGINGVAITVAGLVDELTRSGHEVRVMVPENALLKAKEKRVIRYASMPNPLVADYPIPLYPSISSLVESLGRWKPQVIHVHHPFHVGHMALQLAKHYGVPVVYTYHTEYDLCSENFLKIVPYRIKRDILHWSVKSFIEQVDLVISPATSLTAKWVADVPGLPIATIPSGLPLMPTVRQSRTRLREMWGYANNDVVMLSVCRLSSEKNLNVLIRAVTHLPRRFKLLIVGDGSERKALEETVHRLSVSKRVCFAGKIEHDQLGQFYTLADLFVHTSVVETQGLTFLEALSFGLPVVAIRSQAATTWVTPQVGELSANTAPALARSILAMMKRERAAVAWHAKLIVNEYRLGPVTQRIVAAYTETMERSGKRGKT